MEDEVARTVRIDDPAVDAAAIHARIREGLAQRGSDLPADFPEFERPDAPGLASGLFSAELAQQLERLNASFDQVWVELSLIESHFPIVGAWISRYKRDLHRLVVFYVNTLGRRQQAVNEDLVRLVNRLIAEVDAAGLPALRRDLEDTRARLAAMETKLADRSG